MSLGVVGIQAMSPNVAPWPDTVVDSAFGFSAVTHHRQYAVDKQEAAQPTCIHVMDT